MKFLLTSLVLVSLFYSSFGQFRGVEWGTSMEEVRKGAGENAREARYFDFENGNQSLGFKSQLDLGNLRGQVYSNYHFIQNRLRSGSYVFYELDHIRIDQLIDHLSSEYGKCGVYYGNQKLKRTVRLRSGQDYIKYLEEGHSLEFIWTGSKQTRVVLRVITTGTEEFGTWGWLSYYEKEYFTKAIEPYVIRSMGEDQ